MIVLACATLTMAQGVLIEPSVPRLRTILPNHLTVLVERMPADYVSAQVWLAGPSPRETLATHGYRHLLEHIMARVDGNRWDGQIEALGGVLDAETGRDAVGFRVRVPRKNLPLALDCLAAIVRQKNVSKDAVMREAMAIKNEATLRSVSVQRIGLAWEKQFGPTGLDPFGNTDLLANAVPAELETLWNKMADPRHMAVTVAGNVDVDEVTAEVKKRFSFLVSEEKPPSAPPEKFQGSGSPTGTWAIAVGSPDEPPTAAAIAAGLAVVSQLPEPFFNYSPVSDSSLIVIGTSEDSDRPLDFDAEALFDLGKQLARAWVKRQLSDPNQTAAFRGRLLAQNSGLQPESMMKNIENLRHADFAAAVDKFRRSRR